jgi:PAS domain-containing protein
VLDQALNGDETDNFELLLITKSGYHMEMLLNATSQLDEQRNVIGVVGIGQDITNRLAQEREYLKLIDMANAPVFGANTQEAMNVWKKNTQKLVGYTPEEGRREILVKEFITNEYKTVVQAVLDQAFQGEETGNFEFPHMMEVGVHLDSLLNAMIRCNERGNISGVVSIGQDITG